MLWPGSLSAQKSLLQKADSRFEASAYHEALPLYADFLGNSEGRNAAGPERLHAGLHLAECQRLTGAYEAAAEQYGRWLENREWESAIDPHYTLQYARMLLIRGDLDASRNWFERYTSVRPDDPRGEAGLNSCLQLQAMEQSAFEIVNLSINSPQNDFGASFSGDELWFCSARNAEPGTDPWSGEGFLDLYRCPEWQGEEAEIQALPAPLNSAYHDGPGVFAAASREAIWTRSSVSSRGKGLERKRSFGLALYHSLEKESGWDEPQALDPGLGSARIMHPALSADGEELFFASDAPGGSGGFDLYRCRKAGEGWSAAEWLGPELNTPGDELYPVPDENGNLWFASDGLTGFGGLDLYIAHRRKKEEGWMIPSLLAEPINSRYDDFGLVWLKTDTLGVLASNRPGGQGGDDLYEISRSWKAYLSDEVALTLDSLPSRKLSSGMVDILGQTVKSTTGESAGGGVARVTIPPNGDTVLMMEVSPEGFFTGEVPAGQTYWLEVDKPNYLGEPVVLDTRYADPEATLTVLAEVREMKTDLVVEMNNIYYDYGKSHIREDAATDLLRLLRLMQDYPDMTIELSSHTDSRSSAAYNLKLSRERAESARDFLVTRGIDAGRIQAVGHGENRLRNQCADGVECPEEEHQFNRRTEFRITYFDAVSESKPRHFEPGSVPTPEQIVAAREAFQQKAARQSTDLEPNRAVGAELAVNPWSSGTWQGVQIGIDRKADSHRFDGFAWLGSIRVERSPQGFYRYVIGYLDSREEAEQVLAVIRKAGFSDAFIATYHDGIRTQ